MNILAIGVVKKFKNIQGESIEAISPASFHEVPKNIVNTVGAKKYSTINIGKEIKKDFIINVLDTSYKSFLFVVDIF
jgi:hypothetical protein